MGRSFLLKDAWRAAGHRLLPYAALLLLIPSCLPAASAHAPHRPVAIRTASQATLTSERRRVLEARPLSMFYYAKDSMGLESLQAHANSITLIVPQSYELDRAGALHGQLPSGLRDSTTRAGVPLMPLVINPGFDRSMAHDLLHSLAAQQRAARSLAEAAERGNYLGWQVDFEDLDPADKFAYTRFIARVAAVMHRDRRLVSVAVVPRFSDAFPEKPGPGFRTGQWGAAYDFRGLARVADLLVLMAYDQHTSLTPPGPVAGYDWVRAAVDYAVRRVPSSKLLLGVPFFGREWSEVPGGFTSNSLAYKDLKYYLDAADSEKHWDETSRTTWFQLRDGEKVRTAWFDDARSLREKLKLVEADHLRGYAAWRLGVEDPQFWDKATAEK